MSQTLKPKATGLGALKSRLERLYVTRLRGFATEEMVACTIVFECANIIPEPASLLLIGLAGLMLRRR